MRSIRFAVLLLCACGGERPATDTTPSGHPDPTESIEPASSSTATSAWRPFSDTSPWNMPIATDAALRTDSQLLIDHLAHSSEWPGLGIAIHQWSVPVFDVTPGTPLVTVNAVLSNLGEHLRLSWPVPSFARSAAGTDAHLSIIDRASGIGYDFFQGSPDGDHWNCQLCSTIDLNGSGVRPPTGGPTPWFESHGSRACGFPLIAGLIRVEEVRAGVIQHALILAYPGLRQGYFVPPASTSHGANGHINSREGIPCGGRVQLDPSVDIDALQLTSAGRAIARALQVYGAYVGDYSGSINFYADASPEARQIWSSGILDMAETTRAIPVDRLRVIDWGTPLVGQNLVN